MKQYKVKVKHDNGTANLLVIAESETHAKWRVIYTEGCPECAIVSIKEKTK